MGGLIRAAEPDGRGDVPSYWPPRPPGRYLNLPTTTGGITCRNVKMVVS